jgi:hypothetical protein
MGLTIQDRLHHKSAYKSRNMSLRNAFLSSQLPSEIRGGQHEGEEGTQLYIYLKKFVVDNMRGRRALSFISISYNINKLWLVKILIKNGKITLFFDTKWDKISNVDYRNLLILSKLW